MSRYEYKPLDPSQREFRLLHILPENDATSEDESSTDPVRCTVSHASLDSAPPYDALSYTWGDPSTQTTIVVDGADFLATPNFEAGLRHLRKKDEIVTLWVDALCINQSDIPEKNFQLKQMREIYVQAKSVIAWLGPSNENSEEAMKWIEDYGGRSHQLKIGSIGGPRLISLLDALDGRDVPTDEPINEEATIFAADLREQLSPANSWHADLITALLKFFKRAYWNRIWIVQELASASNLVFVCGKDIASDNAIYDTLRLLRNFTQYQNLKWNRMVQETQFVKPSGVSLTQINTSRPINLLKFRRATHPAPLIHLMRTFRFFSSTDPRDKVFALLGISRDADVLGLRADYNKTCDQVYADAARRLIHAGYVDILGLVQYPKSVPGLQSWVPDLSRIHYRAPLQQRSLERKGPPGSTRLEPKFFASATKENIVLRRENTMAPDMPLSLHGVRVGKIEQVGLHWENEGGVGRWLHDLQRLSQLAVWRAAVADQEIRQGVRKPRLADEKVHTAWQSFKESDLKDVDEKALEDVGLSYYCEWLQTVSKGRRPLLCESSYLGIGPSETEPGDFVFVLLGSDLPFIMRSESDTSEKMQLIGEAYFHGIMDGEVMEKNPEIEAIELC
ncbi:Heterokaryon incompatibility protein (HET) domain containing protein [Hyaloscypha variabilis]